jgi:hypothetical protein
LDCQPGNARYAACFLCVGYATAEDLAPLRYHHAASYQWPRQSRGEPVACLIPVRGKHLIYPHRQKCTSLKG